MTAVAGVLVALATHSPEAALWMADSGTVLKIFVRGQVSSK
jgi:hypothetical protein